MALSMMVLSIPHRIQCYLEVLRIAYPERRDCCFLLVRKLSGRAVSEIRWEKV